MKSACWQLVLGFFPMLVRVEGLMGWSLRRSLRSDDISQISLATPVQLSPSSFRLASIARYKPWASKERMEGSLNCYPPKCSVNRLLTDRLVCRQACSQPLELVAAD